MLKQKMKEFQALERKKAREREYSELSTFQIASIRNQSKRYQISQYKEDLGIMKYIKKRYQEEYFNEGEGKTIPKHKMDMIK